MWEVFKKTDGRYNREPVCSWDKRGMIHFGQKVFEMLGSPKSVALHLDRGRGMVGLKASNADFARPVHKQATSRSYFIRASAFQWWCGVKITSTMRAKAFIEDGMVVFSIDEHGEFLER